MFARVSCLLFLLLAAADFPAGAQVLRIAEVVGVEQGLSQGMVFDICQSRDGFLWIATKDGLNRYDGYRFEVFLPDPFDPFSIAVNEVYGLYEDRRGWLWCVYTSGVDVYVPELNRFFHLPAFQSPEEWVGNIVETSDGSVWIEMLGVLWRFQLSEAALHRAVQQGRAIPEFRCSRITPPADAYGEQFVGICRLNDTTLLAASTRGIYQVAAHSSEQLQYLPLPCSHISGSDVLASDRFGYMVFGCREALWTVSGKTGIWRKLQDLPSFNHWTTTLQDDLWAIVGQTLYRWSASPSGKTLDRKIAVEHPFRGTESFYFTALYVDQSDNIWLGTSGYGLLKVSTVPPKFLSHLNLASQRQIVEDPQGHIFCLRSPRMLYTDKRFEQTRPNPWLEAIPLEEIACRALFDAQGNCWVRSASDKLYRVHAHTKAATQIPLPGFGLLINRAGSILSVSEHALYEYHPRTGRLVEHPFDVALRFRPKISQELTLLYEDSEETLWIMAFEGLLQATPQANGYRFKHFRNSPSERETLSSNFVLCVAEDPRAPQRYLWIGTKGGGLNRLDRQTDRMTHYGLADGLPDRVVYGILPDGSGNLWFSTNKGLCRMSQQEDRFLFKTFTSADGLQSNEFNQGSFLKTRDGTLMFGGVNGLSVFHPDSLHFRNNPPQMRIVSVWVNGERRLLHDNQPLLLSHDQNSLIFEFAALDLTHPAQNQYRYQLLHSSRWGRPVSDVWMELNTRNSVQLANLHPGDYVLRVLGSNNEGTWSLQPAEVRITVRPPWWATTWAYALYALLTGLAALAYFRFRLQRRLAEQEALRLRELDDFKSRFFTNITHEFRTPLTVILGAAERVLGDSVARSHPVAIGQPLSLIKRNGQNLLRLINQLLDLAKLESRTLQMNYVQGDVLAYLRYIVESLQSLAQSASVHLRMENPQTAIVMDYDPERLLQIAHNLISNAIKFTPAGGEVVLRAERSPDSTLLIQVSDTGTGISPEDLPFIFDRFYQAANLKKARTGGTGIGLALTRELTNALGGSIRVESRVGTGTTFTVKLPITTRSEQVVSAPPALAEETETAVATASTVLSTHNHTHSLLIIEDNPDVVEYLRLCLGDHYDIDVAYNGHIGIEKALESVPDLIVSDVMMPQKDGFEVVQTLKNDERTSHIPIVLLTARADVESRIAGLRRGADAYLAKPFHQEELLVTLANLLDLRQKLQARYNKADLALSPQPAADTADLTLEDAFVQKVRTAILERLSDPDLNVESLCRSLAMSQSQLHRKITALTGKNAVQHIRSMRLARAKELLESGQQNISEVAYEVGFRDPKYFSRVFTEEFGVAPSKL